MSLTVAIGQSEDTDTEAAIREVIAQCQAQLAGAAAHAAVFFAPIDAAHEQALAEVQRVFGPLPLIGCTSDGEATSVGGYEEDSLCLLLLSSPTMCFSAAVARDLSAGCSAAAKRAATEAAAALGQAPRLCLTLPESLRTNAVLLLAGIEEGIGQGVPVFGGTATDRWQFGRTKQFFGSEVLDDSLPLLLVGGDFAFAHGIRSGWRPVGRDVRATRVEGHIVHEIDDRPALELYRHYLGAHLAPSSEYPVAVFEESGPFYLRAPRRYDQEEGSIAFSANVPEGARLRLTEASRDDILSAARESIEEAKERLGDVVPKLAFFVSCCARKELLGTRTREELEAVKALLPEGTPICGFYAFGEFSPLQQGGKNRFHNETFVTLLLGDLA